MSRTWEDLGLFDGSDEVGGGVVIAKSEKKDEKGVGDEGKAS